MGGRLLCAYDRARRGEPELTLADLGASASASADGSGSALMLVVTIVYLFELYSDTNSECASLLKTNLNFLK